MYVYTLGTANKWESFTSVSWDGSIQQDIFHQLGHDVFWLNYSNLTLEVQSPIVSGLDSERISRFFFDPQAVVALVVQGSLDDTNLPNNGTWRTNPCKITIHWHNLDEPNMGNLSWPPCIVAIYAMLSHQFVAAPSCASLKTATS